MWDRLRPNAGALPYASIAPDGSSGGPQRHQQLQQQALGLHGMVEVTVTGGRGAGVGGAGKGSATRGIRLAHNHHLGKASSSPNLSERFDNGSSESIVVPQPHLLPQAITTTTTLTQTITPARLDGGSSSGESELGYHSGTESDESIIEGESGSGNSSGNGNGFGHRLQQNQAFPSRSSSLRARGLPVQRGYTRRYEIRRDVVGGVNSIDRSTQASHGKRKNPVPRILVRDVTSETESESESESESETDDNHDGGNNPGAGSPPLSPSSLYPEPDCSLYSTIATVAAQGDHRPGGEPVSPPSSPEPVSGHMRPPRGGDVSPMRDSSPPLTQLEIAKAHHRRHMEEQGRNKNQAQAVSQSPPQPKPQPVRSQIPMMRRERRQHQQAATGNMRQRSRDGLASNPTTQRDDMAGEPTSQTESQLQQSSPGQPTDKQSGRSAVQSFGDRVRKKMPGGGNGKPNIAAPLHIDERPGWRGASGRIATVAPVANDTQAPPLVVPPKSARRQASGAAGVGTGTPKSPPSRVVSPMSPASSPQPETPAALAPKRLNRQLTASPENQYQAAAQAYPSPPTSDEPRPAADNDMSARMSPDYRANVGTKHDAPTVPDQEKAIRRKPPPSTHLNAHAPHMSVSSSVYSVQPQQQQQQQQPHPQPQAPQQEGSSTDPEAAPRPSHDGWVQPGSRFSVTTYATSAVTGSTRNSVESERPPVPPLNNNTADDQASSPEPAMDSVMSRGRPRRADTAPSPLTEEAPVKISMASHYASSPGRSASPAARPHDQLPSKQATAASAPTPTPGRGRQDSVLSLSKALPPAPPELMSANDRVAHLNARLESLGNRRINIHKAIKQMTELMPTDNLLASEAVLRKRDAEKRKVDVLKEELAEVQREEYDLGIKLHRAYKRLDRNTDYEPTGLWVKRVTG